MIWGFIIAAEVVQPGLSALNNPMLKAVGMLMIINRIFATKKSNSYK